MCGKWKAQGMRQKRSFVIVVLLVMAAVGLAAMFKLRANASTQGKRDGDKRDRPVAVAVVSVERRDVPVDLDALGTVVAYKTVTVRAQVDGRLDKVLFTEGQKVKSGDLLAQIDPRPFQIQLHQAQGNLARDQASLNGAELNMKRYETLTQKNYVPQQQLDDQRTLTGQYLAAVQVDQAQVETAQLNLSYARITSPIDGVTGVRLVDPGNLIRASDASGIVVITQLDPISVLFTLPQDDLAQVSEAMRAGALAVDAFERDGVTKLGSGKLLLIDNQINQTTATIRLKAVLPNPERKLWPNQFVKARLHVAMQKNVLVVPASAVQRGPNGTYVYVVKADQTAELRPVVTDVALTDLSIVKSGLSLDEHVVVEGQNLLKPGAKVQTRVPGAEGARERGAGKKP